jgi:ribonucleoside-triphosphate reductase
MYNLKNRIQDQLISPKHRVVRKVFNADKYILEPIEDVSKLKSPIVIPIAGESANTPSDIPDEQIMLMAWIVSEGTLEKGKKGTNRISIYQSKIKNMKKYDEIKKLIKHFNFQFDESETTGFGDPVKKIRLNSNSSKVIHKWFGNDSNIKFIPNFLTHLDKRQSKLFLETYIKGDGFEECKISTTDIGILDQLQIIAVNAGYGFTVLTRKPTIGTKDLYVLRLIEHKDTYIQKIEKIDYDGIIWCPHTENETIIARRNGKVFITGNTPFTNITMDLKPHGMLANESVIIGGKPQEDVYGDFQEEMDMINKAFCEVMLEGDAQGRLFSFPIPTYNLTKDFEWENPKYDKLWEMTAKYGIPYFSNFINSDMSPDDARSMCCRLRLDNRELRKRGGGLFGANPLTGSIGVVTINMARIGYLAKDENEYFEMLDKWMDVAKRALMARREFVEKYMEKGLYPYSKFYLESIAERFGEYFKNHFNTIGLLGLNESIVNFMGEKENIASKNGKEFGLKVMTHMRERLMDYQIETDQLFNLEATPGEGTTYRFAKSDKKKFGDDIITAADLGVTKSKEPYYTNSSQLPVGYTDDVWEALDLQDDFQTKYTGGTVLHIFLGERMPSVESTRNFVRKVAENYTLPYFSITPTFSICPIHGYISGEHQFCPKCDAELGYQEGMEFVVKD